MDSRPKRNDRFRGNLFHYNRGKSNMVSRRPYSSENGFSYQNSRFNAFDYSPVKSDNYQSRPDASCILRVSNLDFAISNTEWDRILRKNFSTITTVRKIRFVSGNDHDTYHHVESSLSKYACGPNDSLDSSLSFNGNRDNMMKSNLSPNSYPNRRNGVAFVTVDNSADASRVIAMFHHKKIGYKKINIQLAVMADNEMAELNRKVIRVIELLSPLNDGAIPLNVFSKKFTSLYGCRIHLNEIRSLSNTIQIVWNYSNRNDYQMDTFDRDDASKDLSSCYIIPVTYSSDVPCTDNSTLNSTISSSSDDHKNPMNAQFNLVPSAYCSICSNTVSTQNKLNKDRKIVKNSDSLLIRPNLRNLTVQVHELMNRHNGSLSLPSFNNCHNYRFGKNSLFVNRKNISTETEDYERTSSIGVPLEHMISCIPNIILKWHPHGAFKQITWARSARTLSLLLDQCRTKIVPDQIGSKFRNRSCAPFTKYTESLGNDRNDSNESTMSGESVDIDTMKNIFSRQVRHVIEKQIVIPISSFLALYHQSFHRQLRVADYGCVKLVELLYSVPDTVQVIGNQIVSNNEEDKLTLHHNIQVNRFAGILYLALGIINRKYRIMQKMKLHHNFEDFKDYEWITENSSLNQSDFAFVSFTQLPNMIENVMNMMTQEMCQEMPNSIFNNRKVNDDQKYSFCVSNFGVTCLDDLIFSIENFNEFCLKSESIGLDENAMIARNSSNNGAEMNLRMQYLSTNAITKGISPVSTLSLGYEFTEILRRRNGQCLSLTNLDAALKSFKMYPTLGHSNFSGLISHENLPFSFTQISEMADDYGAGWPYAACIMSYFANPKDVSIIQHTRTLESTLTITDHQNRIRAVALNIIELIEINVYELKDNSVPVNNLARLYESRFNIPLNPYMYGFVSISEMLNYMSPCWLEIFYNHGNVWIRESRLSLLVRISIVSIIGFLNDQSCDIQLDQDEMLSTSDENRAFPIKVKYIHRLISIKFSSMSISLQNIIDQLFFLMHVDLIECPTLSNVLTENSYVYPGQMMFFLKRLMHVCGENYANYSNEGHLWRSTQGNKKFRNMLLPGKHVFQLLSQYKLIYGEELDPSTFGCYNLPSMLDRLRTVRIISFRNDSNSFVNSRIIMMFNKPIRFANQMCDRLNTSYINQNIDLNDISQSPGSLHATEQYVPPIRNKIYSKGNENSWAPSNVLSDLTNKQVNYNATCNIPITKPFHNRQMVPHHTSYMENDYQPYLLSSGKGDNINKAIDDICSNLNMYDQMNPNFLSQSPMKQSNLDDILYQNGYDRAQFNELQSFDHNNQFQYNNAQNDAPPGFLQMNNHHYENNENQFTPRNTTEEPFVCSSMADMHLEKYLSTFDLTNVINNQMDHNEIACQSKSDWSMQCYEQPFQSYQQPDTQLINCNCKNLLLHNQTNHAPCNESTNNFCTGATDLHDNWYSSVMSQPLQEIDQEQISLECQLENSKAMERLAAWAVSNNTFGGDVIRSITNSEHRS